MDFRRKTKTPESAQQWAASVIGPRGSVAALNEKTRGPVRFWLTAHGLPSAFVRGGDGAPGLTLGRLLAAWNDTTDATLADLKRSAAAWLASRDGTATNTDEDDDADDADGADDAAYTHQEAHHMNTTTNQDDAAQLARILSRMAKPAMDEDAVRALINEEAGHIMSASTRSTMEAMRTELAAAIEEVRSAPRALTVTMGDTVRELPAAARHPLFDTLLIMVANMAVPGALAPMLVGPAGGGKTTACEQVAEALGLDFYTTGAMTGAHELTGYCDGAGRYHATPFRRAFENGGLFLADEMDRSDPAAPIVLNSAIANGFMGFPDKAEPVRKHKDFRMVVAANTYGRGADRLYVGASQLDGATLDRLAPLAWDYDERLERDLAQDDAWVAFVQAARKAAFDQKARVIISPRASMGGAVYRRAGLPFDMVAELALWKGMEAEQRRRIEQAIPADVTRRASIALAKKEAA